MYLLTKCSEPGWDKTFKTESEAIDDLRRHICADCLAGSPGFLDDVVDLEVDGRVYLCRDAGVLLATPCGCEYELSDVGENIDCTNPANGVQTAD